MILIGDINIDILEETAEREKYLNMIIMNGFHVVNKVKKAGATRIHFNGKKAILDHVLTNIEKNKLEISLQITPTSLSDHNMIDIILKVKPEPKKKRQKFTIKTLDEEKFN